jgi:predicted O-methyltransferase YrrM
MTSYDYKIDIFLEQQIKDIDNLNILEFGVKEGRSTKIFLDICKKKNGKLFSVDINDYSNLFDDPNWTFIKSRDDDFKFLKNKLPEKFDIIYLDSLHEAKHVEKIFYYYYNFLKVNGQFYIDDISWFPYLKNKDRDNFYCEINNKETFEKLLEIYDNNKNNFDIFFTFMSSGMCRIVKKKEDLAKAISIKTRESSPKNLIRNILNKYFKK